MAEIHQVPVCCGCGVSPPPTSGDDPDSSTLLSMRFGWRVVRRIETNGTYVAEWRCPTCWLKYKAQRTDVPPTVRRGS